MRKPLKYLLVASGALIALVLVFVVIVAATFDPNDYKPIIIRLAQERTQRTLAIPGKIELTFFPKIGANLGKVSLSEHKGSEQFASVDHAQVSLELLPMLSKRFVVDRVIVDGLNVRVRRFKDGTTNIDDLMSTEEKTESQQVELDIDGVSVTNATLAYQDDQAARTIMVNDLDLMTGPIADGKDSNIRLTGQLTESSTKTAVTLDVSSDMTLDFDKKHYVIKGMETRIDGKAMGYDDLRATAEGDADIQAANQFALAHLRLGFSGKQAAQAIDVKLAVPKLSLSADRISGSGVTGNGQLVSGGRTVDFKIAAPGFEGSPKAFDIAAVTLDATVSEPGMKATAKLTGPFQGQIDKLLFRSPQLALTLEGQRDNLPVKGAIRTALNADFAAQRIELGSIGIDLVLPNPRGGTVAVKASGDASANLAKEALQAALNGTLDGADLALKLGMTGFSAPAYRFDARIASLDLDRYMEQKTATALPDEPGAKPEVELDAKAGAAQPIDLSALKNLNATGTLQIGALKVSNIQLANLRAELSAAQGRAELRPLSASLYGGAFNGSVSATAADKPRFTIKQTLSGINIGPLLKDVASKDLLDGRGDVMLDLTTAGATVDEMKKALAGSARLSLKDGAIRGVNIAAAIRQAKAKIGVASASGTQQGAANAVEKTDFTALAGSFLIANGIARNDDLEAKSPLLRITGAGDIDIGQDRLDYLVKATVVSTLQGQGGPELQALRGVTVPVRLTGPYDAIAWNVDVAGMATELAKAKVDEKKKEVIGEVQKRVEEQKGKIGEELGGRLKGLFGQ